jgi:hypothetical protein
LLPLFRGAAKAALDCTHRTSTVSSCAFCEVRNASNNERYVSCLRRAPCAAPSRPLRPISQHSLGPLLLAGFIDCARKDVVKFSSRYDFWHRCLNRKAAGENSRHASPAHC